MDRMRQSLFSILGNMEGLSFLDLFSGSGIIGVEAASRGAQPVRLVEKDPRKRATIQKNIAFVESSIELVTAPVERFLKADRGSWDLIFLDPPFDFANKGEVLDEACQPPHLEAEGLAIRQRSSPWTGLASSSLTAGPTGSRFCCSSAIEDSRRRG